MGGNLSGGMRVKSVQRGTFALGATVVDIAVASVNMNNCELVMDYVGLWRVDQIPVGRVLNNTTLRFEARSQDSITVQWELTEYSAVKSRQAGIINQLSGTSNTAISNVNTSKAKCIISYRYLDIYSSGSFAWDARICMLTSGTNLQVITAGGGSQVQIHWQVIEFF